MSAGAFVKLPDALLYDPAISDGALRAYAVLAGYARACSSDTFELTLDALGTLLGRSRDQAERRVRELQKRGLVIVHGRHDRRRANRITVLDPQGVIFAGLHVARDAADVPPPDAADVRHHDAADLRHPYVIGREEREGQRSKRSARAPETSPPVDNGGASRPPPLRERCTVHELPGSWSDLAECRGCVADAKAGGYSRRPAF